MLLRSARLGEGDDATVGTNAVSGLPREAVLNRIEERIRRALQAQHRDPATRLILLHDRGKNSLNTTRGDVDRVVEHVEMLADIGHIRYRGLVLPGPRLG